MVWHFTTEYTENDQGDWYSINFELKNYINEKQYNIINKERKALPNRKLDLPAPDNADTEETEETTF